MRESPLLLPCLLTLLLILAGGAPAWAEGPPPMALYPPLRTFTLGEQAVHAENFQLARDRVQMTFSGEFYFAQPIGGQVYGAVFLGQGELRAESGLSYEKDNIQRFLKSDNVEATFSSAVLRFTDDTYERLTSNPTVAGGQRARAQELASELEPRLVRETGLNLSARLLEAIVNGDDPGVFFAEFDGGNRDRFSLLLDFQCRTLGSVFDVNGGEKGLFFQYKGVFYGNDIWTAFYSQPEFQSGQAIYSDTFDLVSVPDYRMEVDLRDPGHWLRLQVELDLVALAPGLQIIPFQLNEGLVEYDDERRKKGVRVLSATLADGTPVGVIQDEWETGLCLVLPQPLTAQEKVTVRLALEGKDSLWSWRSDFHYPRSTTTWYPRHGYLTRSRFDMTFYHPKKLRVASIGWRDREEPMEEGADEMVTHWVTDQPVSFVTFVIGLFDRHEGTATMGEQKIPLEYYSVPSRIQAVKEDFLLAEINNSVRYFSELFGRYPYEHLDAAFFPTRFGQGFPTLLLLPARGYADKYEFAFIAHEAAHQWWGNVVAWRSYRDQWLSEGFAEYSGVLYTALRMNSRGPALELIKEMRRDLLNPPATDTGIGGGKLYEIGPLVLGHRLASRLSRNAYSALTYSKGCLVLRMLHFLFSDPRTGDDKAFFEMMKDFVRRHRNGAATTESFFAVASEHFARSPIGKKYGLHDLNWFLHQWVYQSVLPSYRLEYKIESRQGGGVVLNGTVYQENAPENWFMPLPLLLEFSGNRSASGTVHALGPVTSVQIPLPEQPTKVRLDPEFWVLSEKTTEKRR